MIVTGKHRTYTFTIIGTATDVSATIYEGDQVIKHITHLSSKQSAADWVVNSINSIVD